VLNYLHHYHSASLIQHFSSPVDKLLEYRPVGEEADRAMAAGVIQEHSLHIQVLQAVIDGAASVVYGFKMFLNS
jgi:hypothetical protein